MDLGGFIGRFHPLFVHLPIGFLILAGVFEYLSRKPKFSKLNNAVGFTLFIGALFAILSCVSGWLLANRGAYIERSLFLHRWLGIAVAVFATLCWLIKTKRWNGGVKALGTLMTLMILGVFATGHFGGNMTHGEDYLIEYAPNGVKNILGFGKEEAKEYDFGSLDSIGVYEDLLAPILEERCWKCHQPKNALGGLDMTTKASFLKGGDHGGAIKSGDAFESLIFERITLPVSDRKSMPPFGLTLPYDQVRLIEWWINTGASFEKKIAEIEVPVDIKNWLEQKYQISFQQKSLIESIEVAAAESSSIKAVESSGFQVLPISENSNLLEVISESAKDFSVLGSIKDQITWLDISRSQWNENQLSQIKDFKNLTRLRLQGNPVSDVNISDWMDLENLESLNLNRTKITDQALQSIQKMSALRSVYLVETAVSDEAISSLKTARPNLEIVKGFQFKKIEE